MIASDRLSDSRRWVFGVKLSDENIANFEVLRNVAMATVFGFYTVSQKKSHLWLYLDIHDPITIIFGKSVKQESKKLDDALFSHLTYLVVLHYTVKQKSRNCIFSLKHCMLLCQRTHKIHSNYHLVAVELPFIPKVISKLYASDS